MASEEPFMKRRMFTKPQFQIHFSQFFGDSEKKIDMLVDRVDFLEGHEGKKSASMLFAGTLFGLLGFVFAFIIGFMKFLRPSEYGSGAENESGYGYFPSTVSEMVHDPTEPAGKCFFAFAFIGALLIFMSWYPWELRNAYTGDDYRVLQVSVTTYRQCLPPLGMMLVATVTTTPFAQATVLDLFCISIHLNGALIMFVGYMLCEYFSLYKCKTALMHEREKVWRKRWLVHIAFFYSVFCILQVVLIIPEQYMVCCNDEWVTDAKGLVTLKRTASGALLVLKLCSYGSEVFCGVSLLMSLFTVWWFCDERHADLDEELAWRARSHQGKMSEAP